MEYLPIDQCKEGYLYKIAARNGGVGIFHRLKSKDFYNAFELSRHKFGANYTFDEYHWDDGEPYGTAKPLKELEKVPDDVLNGDEATKLAYLNKWEAKENSE